MNETEWLAKRKKYITATEIPCLLGLNPWSSATKMWKEKTESTFKGNAYTLMGQLLEPVVVELANKILDIQFELYPGKAFYTDEDLKIELEEE